MDEQDIQLGRAEQELAQEEAALATEVTRLEAASTELGRRLQALAQAVAQAEARGAKDAGLSQRVATAKPPAIGVGAVLLPVRQARGAAIQARRSAAATLKQSISTWKAQLTALTQTVSADEVSVASLAAAPRPAPAAPPAVAPAAPAGPSRPPTIPPGIAPVAAVRPPAPAAASPVPNTTPRPAVPPGLRAPGAAAPTPAPAKRIQQRVKMQAHVDLSSADNFFSGFSSNISDGGLFVATGKLLPIGTEVDLNFTLPSGERIDAKGEVRWVRDLNDATPETMPGIGVQFVGLDPKADEAIRRFVQSREPMFYAE